MRRTLAVGVASALLLAIGTSVDGGGTVASPDADPAGDRLVLGLTSPERIVVVDVASGATTSRRVPGGTLCHGELVVTGGRLVVNDGRPGLAALPLAGSGPPARLGPAHQYVASATRGRVWVTTLRYGRRPKVTALREMSVDGRRTFFDARPTLPAFAIAGAFDGGLVVQEARTLRVFDPRRPETSQRVPGRSLLAARGRRLVACDAGCRRLHVTTVGKPASSFRAPRGLRLAPTAAAVSPDGSLLALPVERGRRQRLAIVELATGAIHLVPNGRASVYGALAWSLAGDRLFFAAPNGRLWAYRPHARSATALPIRVRGALVDMGAG